MGNGEDLCAGPLLVVADHRDYAAVVEASSMVVISSQMR